MVIIHENWDDEKNKTDHSITILKKNKRREGECSYKSPFSEMNFLKKICTRDAKEEITKDKCKTVVRYLNIISER